MRFLNAPYCVFIVIVIIIIIIIIIIINLDLVFMFDQKSISVGDHTQWVTSKGWLTAIFLIKMACLSIRNGFISCHYENHLS